MNTVHKVAKILVILQGRILALFVFDCYTECCVNLHFPTQEPSHERVAHVFIFQYKRQQQSGIVSCNTLYEYQTV
jgi:hypothetical protein